MKRVGVSHHDVFHVISVCSFFCTSIRRFPEGNIGGGM